MHEKEHMEMKPGRLEKLGESWTVTMKLYKYYLLFIGILDTSEKEHSLSDAS